MIRLIFVCVLAGFAIAAVAALGMVRVVTAQSSDITQEKLDTIQQRCSSSQLAVQQIEKLGAVSRINRGRAYDQMLRQVSAFNSRLAYNNVSSPELIDLTGQLQTAVNKFRDAFNQYDTDLSDSLKVNCKDKPADYYNMIVRAREDRSVVGEQVKAIVGLTSQYREALVKYGDTIK
jgi:hypothetical protein